MTGRHDNIFKTTHRIQIETHLPNSVHCHYNWLTKIWLYIVLTQSPRRIHVAQKVDQWHSRTFVLCQLLQQPPDLVKELLRMAKAKEILCKIPVENLISQVKRMAEWWVARNTSSLSDPLRKTNELSCRASRTAATKPAKTQKEPKTSHISANLKHNQRISLPDQERALRQRLSQPQPSHWWQTYGGNATASLISPPHHPLHRLIKH